MSIPCPCQDPIPAAIHVTWLPKRPQVSRLRWRSGGIRSYSCAPDLPLIRGFPKTRCCRVSVKARNIASGVLHRGNSSLGNIHVIVLVGVHLLDSFHERCSLRSPETCSQKSNLHGPWLLEIQPILDDNIFAVAKWGQTIPARHSTISPCTGIASFKSFFV